MGIPPSKPETQKNLVNYVEDKLHDTSTVATIPHNSYDNKMITECRKNGKIAAPDQKNSLIGLFLCMKWAKKPEKHCFNAKKGL